MLDLKERLRFRAFFICFTALSVSGCIAPKFNMISQENEVNGSFPAQFTEQLDFAYRDFREDNLIEEATVTIFRRNDLIIIGFSPSLDLNISPSGAINIRNSSKDFPSVSYVFSAKGEFIRKEVRPH